MIYFLADPLKCTFNNMDRNINDKCSAVIYPSLFINLMFLVFLIALLISILLSSTHFTHKEIARLKLDNKSRIQLVAFAICAILNLCLFALLEEEKVSKTALYTCIVSATF